MDGLLSCDESQESLLNELQLQEADFGATALPRISEEVKSEQGLSQQRRSQSSKMNGGTMSASQARKQQKELEEID